METIESPRILMNQGCGGREEPGSSVRHDVTGYHPPPRLPTPHPAARPATATNTGKQASLPTPLLKKKKDSCRLSRSSVIQAVQVDGGGPSIMCGAARLDAGTRLGSGGQPSFALPGPRDSCRGHEALHHSCMARFDAHSYTATH
ncbi:hypothetical protein E2C01_097190 [Portunus trituberculatus]|uniref:Uncharacterized protein n=1 Tax=Portunus trituberculatus TaxID=210409 RepID=A0A5B7JZT9_PORTR|nr:hypothetical protein [Portunus trituberculatus]